MPTEVQRIATPATALEMAESIRRVWTSNVPLTNQILWLILALWDIETATGSKMWCNNAGNIIRTPGWSGDWYKANDSGNIREFRAYPTRDAGAAGLVGLLTSTTRPKWASGLLSGSPDVFVRSLKGEYGGPHYFEADLDKYLSGFKTRYAKYAGTEYLGPDYDGSTDEVTNPGVSVPESKPLWYVMASAALGAALIAWRTSGRR